MHKNVFENVVKNFKEKKADMQDVIAQADEMMYQNKHGIMSNL